MKSDSALPMYTTSSDVKPKIIHMHAHDLCLKLVNELSNQVRRGILADVSGFKCK